METFFCEECGQNLPLGDFTKNKNYKEGHVHVCKYCMRNRQSPGSKIKTVIEVRPYVKKLGVDKISELTGIGSGILNGLLLRKEHIPDKMQIIIRKALGL